MQLKLRTEAVVDGAGIFLDQVVDSPTPLPQIRLASAPALGQTVSLSRAQVLDLAQKSLPELSATNFVGANALRISRRARPLASPEMLELLVAELNKTVVKDKGELELNLTRPWTPALVPDEPLTVRIMDLPASGLSANFILHFELWTGKELIGKWHLAAQARLWREIPIVQTATVRGELVRDADVTLERRDLLVNRDAFLDFPTDNNSLEFTENIPPGRPILNRSMKMRPAIRRGKIVEGVFQDGGLNIALKVEALEDGLLGQVVRVRNPKTKRELSGKVQNEQTILISL